MAFGTDDSREAALEASVPADEGASHTFGACSVGLLASWPLRNRRPVAAHLLDFGMCGQPPAAGRQERTERAFSSGRGRAEASVRFYSL